MADLATAVDVLERAVEAARRLVGDDGVADVAATLAAVAERRGITGDVVVVALAGGTGSGKSSLLNALAGEQVAATGVLRPTTDAPTAWLPRVAPPALVTLLDDAGIDQRAQHAGDDRLAVVDLPDFDSVETAHRARVDALLPRLDAVLWVTDPQKYNDRAVHERIAARARYAPQFLFVLNQADRLQPSEVGAVRADFAATLVADGIPEPQVLVAAAAPPEGEPVGVEEVRGALARLAADKRLVVAKLVEDLRGAVGALTQRTGVHVGAGTDAFDASWQAALAAAGQAVAERTVDAAAVAERQRASARAAVAAGSGPAGRVWHALRRSPAGRALGFPQDREVEAGGRPAQRPEHTALDPAVTVMARAVTDLSSEVGRPVGRRLRDLLGELDRDVRVALTRAREDVAVAGERPDGQRPAPARPRWWAFAAVAQTLVTVAVVVGAVWWWADPASLRPGDLPWPALLVVGGVVVGLWIARAVRASGARWGRNQALHHREVLVAATVGALDRRVGDRVRAVLADRDHLAEALADAAAALAPGEED